MHVIEWFRQLDRRQAVGLLIVLAVVFAGERLANTSHFIEANSARTGWRPAIEADALARDVHRRVNDERQRWGLAPLSWDDELAALARGWSERMIAQGYEHSDAAFRATPRFPGTGENIAMGQRSTGELHVGWMTSAGHRANILSPAYEAIGIGLVCRKDGSLWATQIFGAHATPQPPQRIADDGRSVVRRDPGMPCPSVAYRPL